MKRLFFLVVLSAFVQVSMAQLSARDCLKLMPDSLLPYLSENNKLDMLDFMDAKMKAEVTNALDGKSEMTALSDDSLVIQLNASVSLRLFILDVAEPEDSLTQIIGLVRSYKLSYGQQSSVINYFTPDWKPIATVMPLKPMSAKLLESYRNDGTLLKRDELLIPKE